MLAGSELDLNQAVLKFKEILLPLLPVYWDYIHVLYQAFFQTTNQFPNHDTEIY